MRKNKDEEKSFIEKSLEVQLGQRESTKRVYRSQYEIERFLDDFSEVNNAIPDPTITGFKIYWHFDSPTGLLADESHVNSALAYLKRIGDSMRYRMLSRFIALLSELSVESSWVFNNITGLDEIFKENFHNVIRKHDINIETYETIDQRVMSLMHLYRNVVYDFERGCYVLPINLRRFSMSIFVYDTRAFHNVKSNKLFPLRQFNMHDPRKMFHNLFDLGHCTFMNESGAEFFGNVSNTDNEYAKNKLFIHVEKAAMSNLLMYLDDKTFSELYNLSTFEMYVEKDKVKAKTEFQKMKDKLYKRMKSHVMNEIGIVRGVNEIYENIIKDTSWTTRVIEHVGSVAAKSVTDAALRKLNNLYLGNVYGFGLNDIAALRTGDPLAINTRRHITESTTLSLSGGVKYKDLGNVNS